MKPVSLESTVRLGAKASSLLLLLGLLGTPAAAQVPSTWNSSDYGSYFNNSNLPYPDATNFVNTGTWNIFTTAPYQTSDTLNFTNYGVMTGSIGWDFGFYPSSSGYPGWSVNFFNDTPGIISALDGTVVLFQYLTLQQSYLLISATNIVNKGLLEAGANGEIVLNGANIDLSYCQGLEITPITGLGSPTTTTNFSPDTAIYDEYWEATNGTFYVGGSPSFGTTVGTFTGTGIGFPCNTNGNTSIGPLTNCVVDSFVTNTGLLTLTGTNVGGSTTAYTFNTNEYHQGVYVYPGINNSVTAQIRFSPTGDPSNAFQTVAIQLASTLSNSITAEPQNNFVYMVDSFASSTNHFLAVDLRNDPNALCNAPTYRPTAVVMSRTEPNEFASGTNGNNGVPANNFFYDPTGMTAANGQVYSAWTNQFVNGGSCATYSALVDNVAEIVPSGGSVTNLPGRVQIYAGNLNLNQTHVRGEGQIVIQATNLIGSANASMDCQNLSFNLTSTNGQLNFVNLALPTVARFHGTVSMWTAVWSNTLTVLTPNYSTNGSTNNTWLYVPLTNTVMVNLAITVVDAGGLLGTQPVAVQDLDLHGTNITVTDSVNVNSTFLLDGLSATLQGNVFLSGALQNWTSANAPKLRYFTNNGALFIPNNAHFGDTGSPTNYLAFVNNGIISAGGEGINSVYLQIKNGVNQSLYSAFNATMQTGQLAGATVQALTYQPIITTNNSIVTTNLQPGGGPISFYARSLQITNSILEAYGSINFTVTNALFDGGSGGSNTFLCVNGFNLNSPAPTSGDLLGTKIYDTAAVSVQVNHTWAGVNSGAVAAGFTNHTAIGTLVLYPISPQLTGYKPKFAFYSATGNNAMYVNHLDLSVLTDFTNELSFGSGMTIYYAHVNLNGNVITNGFSSAEAYLNNNPNLFGSHLQWVSGVVGLSAGTKGSAYASKYQLSAVSGASSIPGRGFQLAETIMPAQTNITQASTDLVHWVPIYTNIGSYLNYGSTTITDPNATNYRARFYRFSAQP